MSPTTRDVWVVVVRPKDDESRPISHAFYEEDKANMVADIERISAAHVAIVKVLVHLG